MSENQPLNLYMTKQRFRESKLMGPRSIMGHPGDEFKKAGGEACLEPGKEGRARETDCGIISIQLVVKIL